MALTWDLTKCEDWEKLRSDKQWPYTYSMIWATMGLGIGDLSEANLPEFYARMHLWEKIHGAWITKDGEDEFFTPAQVRRYQGLQTNVYPMETRAKWLKRICGSQLTEACSNYKRSEDQSGT